jgi:hypothetical protein
MGFSPVAVVQQVHSGQVTHITRSNNTFNQTQYTKHNIKGHSTTMNTKQIRQYIQRKYNNYNKYNKKVKHAI